MWAQQKWLYLGSLSLLTDFWASCILLRCFPLLAHPSLPSLLAMKFQNLYHVSWFGSIFHHFLKWKILYFLQTLHICKHFVIFIFGFVAIGGWIIFRHMATRSAIIIWTLDWWRESRARKLHHCSLRLGRWRGEKLCEHLSGYARVQRMWNAQTMVGPRISGSLWHWGSKIRQCWGS